MITASTHETITLRVSGDPLVADVYTPPDAGDQAPLLLIHGWGGSGRTWAPAVEQLRERYGLIVPDLPGVGRSLPVRRGRTMAEQVLVLEALLDQLGIQRLRLVGHSMGGGMAILLAARRPDLVERLALVGSALFRNDAERSFFNVFMEISGLVMLLRPEVLADVPWLTQMFATRFFYRVPDDPALLREGLLDYLRMDYSTALTSARSATSYIVNDAAAQLRCPTLLIVSRQDQVMPVSNVDYTAKTIADCRVHWIEECGHIPMVEKPDEFVEVLTRFLDSHQ
jgi:pimeloyl-ACP methyl ester carboxylesterase